MLKKTLPLTAVLTGLLLGVPVAHAISIRIEDPKVVLKLRPGETHTGTLGIQNPEDRPFTVRVYTEDWSYMPVGTGEKNFVPAGALEDSASNWLTVTQNEFILDPYSRRDVGYSIFVPQDVKGTYRTVVFFETAIGEAQREDGAAVLVAARLGTIVVVGIDGTVESAGTVADIGIHPPTGNRPAEFTVTFANTGNADIELKGNGLILDSSGLVKGRFDLESIHTQGGMTATRTSQWVGRLDPGTYEIVFTFDLGDGQIIVEERRMTVGS